MRDVEQMVWIHEGGRGLIYVRFKKLTDTAITPTKGSAFAAGYDLYADTTQEIVVEPGDTVPFCTGGYKEG